MMKKVVFCDTNKLFGIVRRLLLARKLEHSFMLSQENYTFVTSTFVLEELYRICLRDGIYCNKDDIIQCCDKLNIEIIVSDYLNSYYGQFVNDEYDIYILQDAINIDASVLRTNNLKDFDISKIKKDFNITVTNHLP